MATDVTGHEAEGLDKATEDALINITGGVDAAVALNAVDAAVALNKARHELADATIAERNAVAHERLSRAYSEQLLVDEVGGDEKALGSNEDARKRRFRIELDKDPVYQVSVQALDVAVERLIVATRDFECAKTNYDVALIRAGLYR